ncbi:MAG: DNA repair protein RecN [Fusobacteriaceae bacterium]
MLRELKIENLAIIDRLDLEFEDGFVSLTGETGAGKSIIMNGVNLLIGEKASIDMIRDGEETLLAQGVFQINKDQVEELKNLGLDIDDNEVIVRRYLDRNGRGKAFVNNIRVPISSLKEIMCTLVDIVGQHSHQMLLSKSNHIKLLDKFIGDEGRKTKLRIEELYEGFRNINEEIDSVEKNRKELLNKKEFYEFQLEEINSINPKIDEDLILEDEYKKLFNAGKIKEKLQNTQLLLRDGEINALNFIHNSKKSLEVLSKYGEEFKELQERLEKIYYELEDAVDAVATIDEDIECNDIKLEKTITRLDHINKLKMKYGSNINEILDFRDELDEKLKSLEMNNFELSSLIKKKEKIEDDYSCWALKLRELRKKKAFEIERDLKSQLIFLNMENTEFKAVFEELKTISSSGMDSVEFFISTNLGQSIKPLWKIASGGEVSRIMLALKVIFSKVDNIAMLLFDEIDSGVGGETVKKIASKLNQIGKNSQLICITHSAAIAAKSNQQFYIEKKVVDGKTYSSVKELKGEERVMEIARMLAGENPSASVIKHAKELLDVE